MSKHSDLSPWAHPKAQQWYQTLMNKSRFIDYIVEVNETADDSMDITHARLLNAILVILARPGIWPERDVDILQRISKKISSNLIEQTRNPARRGPLSIEDHQRLNKHSRSLEQELEILRRRTGESKRQTILRKPPTWKQFWN